MKMNTLTWIIIASALVILGAAIVAASLFTEGWSPKKLSTNEYITTNHRITDDFSRIDIDTNTANILLLPSDDDSCKVIGYEEKDCLHSVNVKDDTLWIKVVDNRKWYHFVGIHFESPQLKIYLPKEKYKLLYLRGSTGHVDIPADFFFGNIDVAISTGRIKNFASASDDIFLGTSTGDIITENITAASVTASVSTGDVTINNINCTEALHINTTTGDVQLADINCGSFSSTGSTGHINMTDLIAEGVISLERSTGDINFESCDAGEIHILTDTGHINGSLLTEKIFIAETDTGDITVPKTTSGGVCELKTDTGDIRITIAE